MKVLWLCNIILPKIATHLGVRSSPVGGWLSGISDNLKKQSNIELAICFPFSDNVNGSVDDLIFYSFSKQNRKNHEKRFCEIIGDFSPEIVHIFGTEYPHSLEMVKACEKLNIEHKVVISIQGLVSIYHKHYLANLPNKVVHAYSLKDILKFSNVNKRKKNLEKNGKYEVEAIKNVKHIIGRTDWDKACTQRINPSAEYHFCNETLRDSFYNYTWDIDMCEEHSIFVSQCTYPIKGMHYMLEAMADVVKVYPDAKLYTTGANPLKLSLNQKIRQTYYNRYLGKLIKKYSLENSVEFLGSLKEEEMCNRFLQSNVFVSPSSIENSPNSVGEAMLLGVPTISSDVGGIKNMLTHEKEGFIYQADAPYMLAYYIKKLFEDKDLQLRLSKNAQNHAAQTHNSALNAERLVEIYNIINRGIIK